MKPKRTWILIADGGRARVVENLGPGRGVHAVPGMTYENELPPNRELLSDRPGRSFESSSNKRSAVEQPDAQRELKHSFAKSLAEVLKEHVQQNTFDRLIIVAPAPTMGNLRSELHKSVRDKVMAELVLDLTKVPDTELPDHLSSVLAI